MARAYNARCIVLKKTKLKETDAIITMLAENGEQIRAVANGVRKPGNRIGARLEPFALVDVLLHEGRSLDTVREVRTVAAHEKCREGLERPACANVIAELLEKLGRDGAALEGRVFPMSITALETIGRQAEERCALLVAAHIFKTMAMQGFAPATRHCALCGDELGNPQCFDVSLGGVICGNCEQRLRFRPHGQNQIARWVDALLYSTFEQLAALETAPQKELLNLAQRWVSEHLSLNIRSIGFLNTLL